MLSCGRTKKVLCWLFSHSACFAYCISLMQDSKGDGQPEVYTLYFPLVQGILTNNKQTESSCWWGADWGILKPKVSMWYYADFGLTISFSITISLWIYEFCMLHDLYMCICYLLHVCMSHRGMVGPLHSDSILGPLDVCCRLGPPGHTGQIVRSPSHQEELRGSINHRVLRGDWRRHTQIQKSTCTFMQVCTHADRQVYSLHVAIRPKYFPTVQFSNKRTWSWAWFSKQNQKQLAFDFVFISTLLIHTAVWRPSSQLRKSALHKDTNVNLDLIIISLKWKCPSLSKCMPIKRNSSKCIWSRFTYWAHWVWLSWSAGQPLWPDTRTESRRTAQHWRSPGCTGRCPGIAAHDTWARLQETRARCTVK